ncbi:hypothetical protein C3L56_07665, partial [Veillonellaceae bacterium M2-4]|nr:hypothetical protein [Veillonellaceae bacterium M2-4]
PKGADGKSNSVTLSGKDGTIGVQGPTGADGKDGNSVTLNGKDGSIGIKGKDGDNKVDITTGNGKVGLDGTDGETRIIVKDGNKNNELATMNDGLKFKGDDGNAIGVKLNKQVNIVGGAKIIRDHETITNLTDNNIGVESIADEADGTNAKMKIRLAKNLSDLESITFNSKDKTNPMVIDGAGRTIKDITTINFLKDGKNNSITGLSNVTWPDKDQRGTDFDVSKAATQGQIQDVENAVDEKLKKSNQGFDILVGEDTEDHRANIALGKDKKETVEFAAGNSLDVTLDKDNKKVIYSLKDDIEVGKEGQPGQPGQAGKDGKVTVNGKDGEKVTIDGKDGKIESKAKDGTTVTVNGKDGTVGAKGTDGTTVTMNGKDGTIGAKGPKGANGKDGASVTINGKDGITTITGATDDKDKKNVIALDGKDGKMGVTGKDGNSVTLNGQDGSIDMKGKDGTNKVQITTKDGKVGVDGKDGDTRLVVKEGTKTHELATMNDGMQFDGDNSGTVNKLKLNQKLTVTGGITDNEKLSQDNNIGVIADGQKTLTLRLAKELKGLDSITFGAGDTAMKIDGTQKTIDNITKMTFKTTDNQDSIVVDGTNKVITGLSNTSLPTDLKDLKADQAASQGQLKQVLDKANDTDKFAVKYDKNTDGSVNKNSITLGGDTNGTVIKNVGAGSINKDSKEAVNGSQL